MEIIHLSDTKTRLGNAEKDSSAVMLCAVSQSIYRSTIKMFHL